MLLNGLKVKLCFKFCKECQVVRIYEIKLENILYCEYIVWFVKYVYCVVVFFVGFV